VSEGMQTGSTPNWPQGRTFRTNRSVRTHPVRAAVGAGHGVHAVAPADESDNVVDIVGASLQGKNAAGERGALVE
jgi:hypothetical protein